MNNKNTTFDIKRYANELFSLKNMALYYGIMILIIVVCFFKAFWWMPPLWLSETSYSPGPMAAVLFGVIVFFKFKQIQNPFRFTRSLKRFLIFVGVLAAIFYFGMEHPGKVPLSKALVPASFCALFIIMTGLFFYTSSMIKVKTKPIDSARVKKLGGIFGHGFIVLALIVHILAVRGDLPRLSIVSYLGLIIGLVLVIFGWNVLRQMLFPALFLLYMLPSQFIDAYLGGPMRLFATRAAVDIMNMFGTGVTRIGTTMSIGDMTFSVSAACSGLRSLMALSALGAAFAFATQPTLFRKYFVALSALPIAVVANVVRLCGVGVTAKFFGQKFAMVVFHDNAAIFLYILATLLLFSVDKLFKVQWLKIENW